MTTITPARQVRVVVTDTDGTVLDLFFAEVDPALPDPKQAQNAVLDVAQSIQFGVA